jgi:hypothetical protein
MSLPLLLLEVVSKPQVRFKGPRKLRDFATDLIYIKVLNPRLRGNAAIGDF